MNQTITIRLDPATTAALEEESRKTSRSKGRIVREALKVHLQPLRRPSDLSVNKKYLRDIGSRRRG
ncbi:ribbon-helix-helix protein, CopG family [Candidatus Curtissbacteria bacterium]|nr:ribbon-helix-helix protein, CopG family [Candidatus Curtissbacteria bacterium]